jgi:hypothetical protein
VIAFDRKTKIAENPVYTFRKIEIKIFKIGTV